MVQPSTHLGPVLLGSEPVLGAAGNGSATVFVHLNVPNPKKGTLSGAPVWGAYREWSAQDRKWPWVSQRLSGELASDGRPRTARTGCGLTNAAPRLSPCLLLTGPEAEHGSCQCCSLSGAVGWPDCKHLGKRAARAVDHRDPDARRGERGLSVGGIRKRAGETKEPGGLSWQCRFGSWLLEQRSGHGRRCSHEEEGV